MAQPHGFFQGKTVAELSRQVRNQEVRCIQLTQAALDAIHQLNPAINAFVSLNVAEALHTAQLLDREIDEGQYRGPLHGIPIAIKDNAWSPSRFFLWRVTVNGVEHPIREAINGLTSVWNLLGLPAINVPAGTVDGLPCGLQIIAGPNQDEKLLAWLAALQV
ncbi:Glutamyl-tRNA(Gln) amidotransferase subunit A [Pseudomonas sp. 31 R 17]|uniref:amidase family protein n=1 Tax=unclassified Pseudomonas TaxID=196821 RepID=UPI0008129F47|nr:MULTISPECIES: amidase family protein [unclassified Pseudomonas]MDO4234326.1 amidase family protein [Pseudomonas sp.]CRM01157.1 Glutamyl-tRNA(Gln) amidotransferase subunit A [Pseudomonas sp. 31 R 17]